MLSQSVPTYRHVQYAYRQFHIGISGIERPPVHAGAAEKYLDKNACVNRNYLLGFLGTEHTTVIRVTFANFNHITEATLNQLKSIVVMDSDADCAGFKMFIHCRETEYLEDYFRKISLYITVCKTQIAGRIQHVQAVFRRLQRVKLTWPKDATSDSLEKNGTIPFQMALQWHHWRKMANVRRRKRKRKLERLNFALEYFFRPEKKLNSLRRLLHSFEEKVQLQSAKEIEMDWDCRSKTKAGPGKDDFNRRIMRAWIAHLQTELEKLGTARARWNKANPIEKGYIRGFAFSLAEIPDE